jgi:transposase
VRNLVPAALRLAMNPVFDSIQCLNEGIEEHDKNIEELSDGPFSETNVLRQVHGVGPLIALVLVATIGDPARFDKSLR